MVCQFTSFKTRVSGCFQRLLRGRRVGQQPQRGSDQRVRLPQFLRGFFDPARQRNAAGARHQQAEGDRLRIAIGELRVIRPRKQQFAPVGRKRRQSGVALLHLLDRFVAQQPAQPRGDLGQRLRGFGRDQGFKRSAKLILGRAADRSAG